MTGYIETPTNYPYFIVRPQTNKDIGGTYNITIVEFDNATAGDTSTVDNGGNFNSFRFTAPEKGLYHFDVAVGIINNAGGYDDFSHTWGFCKNFGLSGTIYYPIGDNWSARTTNVIEISAACSLSLSLNSNDTVLVYFEDKRFTEILMTTSYFSGHLVKGLAF
jgi:hypothetical protein